MILASGSEIRANLLRKSRVSFQAISAKVDEQTLKASFRAEGWPAKDVADGLAEAKAKKVSSKFPSSLVLGCDQVLEFNNDLLSKPETRLEAVTQLKGMNGKSHKLFSAAVIYEDLKPVWRHVGVVNLHMRMMSDNWIDQYVERNWRSIAETVGCYKLEEEGPRLFSRIEGDHFHVLGLPLIELLSYLTTRGKLKG